MQLDGADLRDICLGDLRMVGVMSVTVRDEPWNTIPGDLRYLRIQRAPNAFSVEVGSAHRYGSLVFSWFGRNHWTV